MKRIYPAPEAIDGGKWNIQDDSHPRVSLLERKMYVPLADHPQARAIRAHEMAHVAFTPKDLTPYKDVMSRLTDQVVQHCEDHRVNKLAQQRGIDMSSGIPKVMLDAILYENKMRMQALPYVTTALACTTEEDVAHVLKEGIKDFPEILRVYKTAKGMFGDSPVFETTLEIAEWLELALPEETKDRKTVGSKPKYDGGDAMWGTAYLQEPPLTLPKKQRGRKVADSGSVLSAPWRTTSDQKIFRSCLKAPRKGTVLIDASGSMSFTEADIENLVSKIPAGTIAAYCGKSVIGIIRVLAKHGKICSPEEFDMPYANNTIDGPALEWLGKQQAPRIWLSDGAVTGRGPYEDLIRDARRIQHKFKIMQALDFKEAHRLMKARG